MHTFKPALPGCCPTGGPTGAAPSGGAVAGPAPAGGQACTPLALEGCPPEMLLLGEACPPAFHFTNRWSIAGF